MKHKRHVNLTAEVITQVNERADAEVGEGRCEDCKGLPDWRGLQYHEPVKGQGGTIRVFTADEVVRLCGKHHSARHGIREV